MSVVVTIEPPESVLPALEASSEGFAREMRRVAAVKRYEMGQVSQGKAAEIAGRSRGAFLMSLARFGVSPFQVSPDELEEELAE
jgi:predicted HTH domain antitoxin